MTGSTHAHHRHARSPRPMPEGPARDSPIAGPRTGTTRSQPSAPASAGASGRHIEPGSRPASACPAQPPNKAGGTSPWDGERHHGVRKADRSAESDRTGRGAAHRSRATRHAVEARRQPQPRHTDRCQAATATGCRKPGQRAQPAPKHGTETGARQHQTYKPQTPARKVGYKQTEQTDTHTPTPQPGEAGCSRNSSPSTHTHRAHPSQQWRGTSGARTQTHKHPNTSPRSGGAQPQAEPRRPRPDRRPQPGVAGYKRGAPTNTRTPQHASQQLRGAAETRARAHTPTPPTPARSCGVQAERAHRHTHTSPSAQPGVARRSRNPSPSTHTHTAHPSQEWRGTSGARPQTHTPRHPSQEWRGAAATRALAHTSTPQTPSQEWRGTSGARPQTHTHPNSPARSGGAQPNSEPRHTDDHRTPQPGVAGYKLSAPTNTHTAHHPRQEWRGAAETRAQAHTPTPHTPARSGGVRAGRTHKHTPRPTPRPGVAGRSRKPSQSTHSHTPHPSQEWPGTSGACPRTQTHRNAPARSGGAQPLPKPRQTPTPQTPARSGGVQAGRAHKHTHSPTSQPGVAGRS